jgi:hypothetical protein
MKGQDLPVNLQGLQAFSPDRPDPHCLMLLLISPMAPPFQVCYQRPGQWTLDSHLIQRTDGNVTPQVMGPRYVVRHFDDQRGYYLLCNMVTLQSLGSFSLSVDKSNPIDRCQGNGTLPGYRGHGTGFTYGRLTYCGVR